MTELLAQYPDDADHAIDPSALPGTACVATMAHHREPQVFSSV